MGSLGRRGNGGAGRCGGKRDKGDEDPAQHRRTEVLRRRKMGHSAYRQQPTGPEYLVRRETSLARPTSRSYRSDQPALARLERGDYPDRARLEDTLTDGYACALSLDAECERIERRIAEHAAQLTGDNAEEHAQELLSTGTAAQRPPHRAELAA